MIDLNTIQKQKQVRPPRITLYGRPKIGKSTFAASIPDCLIIDIEDGLDNIETASHRARTYTEVIETLDALLTQQHQFKAVAIDSVDWLEKLIHQQVCDERNVSNIEDIGYGKGYVLATNCWQAIIDRLDRLRVDRNMVVMLLGHDQVKRFDDPTTESYDRHQLNMHKQASDLVKEWSDAILFCGYDTIVRKEDAGFNKKKAKATHGTRTLTCSETPAIVAGNRYNLPEKIPFDGLTWEAFTQYIANAQQPQATQ